MRTHPKSLKIAHDLMQYSTVKHVVFGIHDFSKAMGIHITPENWTEELVWESTNPGLRIQTVAQSGLVHYHVKDWRAT